MPTVLLAVNVSAKPMLMADLVAILDKREQVTIKTKRQELLPQSN
jgi:hypothetical protein